MKIIVLKFGGTSVGTLDRIIKISKIIISYIKKRYKVIVVTSAMAEVTTITLYLFFIYEMIILDIFIILSNVPTDVPPNFKTIIFIDILYLNFYI